MCGIVGLAGADTTPVGRMNQLLVHRGPDDAGEYCDREAGVALAMRRLSIIDLETGHQPMQNDGCARARGERAPTVTMVYNGEVYNAPAIRPRLEAAGHRFVTSHSDTEVLLHLYEDKQERMLDELNGMFAFVVHDRTRNILFGARDRLGIKPLYYVNSGGSFGFASELKSFLAWPGLRRTLDLTSVFHYMSLLYVPGDRSIFEDVKRLPPGHWFKFDLATRQLTIEQWWDLDVHSSDAGRATENRSEIEWAEIIRFELRESVRRRMLSDVPIGCSLSGGIDSSAIVGLLGEIGHPRIKTYTVGFVGQGEDAWNELPLAREVARRWGTDHHEITLEPERLLDDLVRMVWHLDEPYAGGLPSWYVFGLMSETVKVGLTGTGGDEDFGSYGKYRFFETSRFASTALARRARFERAGKQLRWLWSPVRSLVEAVPDSWIGSARRRRLAGMLDLGGGPVDRYFFNAWYYLSDETKRASVFAFERNGLGDTADLLREWFDRAGTPNVRDALAYVDFKTQLPDEFLSMTDRLSMAHSLEARVPFLDHTFVETVFRIPASTRSRLPDLKYLLKKAVGDLLPPAVLTAGKRGFVIPIALWLRGPLRPLVNRLLAPERLRSQGIYDPRFYTRFVRPHLEARADYTWQIWAALMFQLWHLAFVESRSAESAGTPSWTWRDVA
jgi:asparagine synthase (glutamine-hydrolysing)